MSDQKFLDEAALNHNLYKDYPHKERMVTEKLPGCTKKFRIIFKDNTWQPVLWVYNRVKSIDRYINFQTYQGRTLQLREWAMLYDLDYHSLWKMLSDGETIDTAIKKCKRGFSSSQVANPFCGKYKED